MFDGSSNGTKFNVEIDYGNLQTMRWVLFRHVSDTQVTITGYANNTGYRSGSSSVGYGAYENNRNSAVAVAGSTSTSAQGYSNSTQRDGNAEYQIYQVEKQKADNQVKILNDTVLVLMTELQVSNFSVAPKQTASKSIYCSAADSRFDEVRVSFSLNGKPYTVTFK